MKSRRRILIGAGIGFVALLALPFLLPLGLFIPELELIASEQLRAPVKVESLRLFILPLPHLTVSGITVGKKAFLEVSKVVITPHWASVFDSPKVISEIRLEGVVIGQALVARATNWAARSGAGGPAAVRVERIELTDAFVNLTDFKMRDIDAELELTPEGGLSRAQVHADHDRLSVTLVPRDRDYIVELAARNWKLPAGPPLLMSSLTASGTLNPRQGLALTKIDGQLYDGTVSGKLNVAWGKEWTIAGKLDISDVEIQPIVALFTKDTTISGRLTANPVVDMRATSPAQLAEAVDVESDFKVEKGILYNMSLGNAPKALLNKDALKGGQTQFDRFSGHIGVDAAGYYLTKIEISSGVLAAEAEVFISSKQELSGQIDVAIKGTSGLVSTPLALSGTVQAPLLYPSKMALAGAVAGTALLGPGLGTTIGMKAARFTQKLFGKEPAKKKKAAPEKAIPEKADAANPATAVEKKQPAPGHTGR
ncbi:MAG: AsmA-like C-terminal region-containing protein [Betaproteobacteria bacterium]|jgi:hypothetical protein